MEPRPKPIPDEPGQPDKLLTTSPEVTRWQQSDELLRAIIAGAAGVTGAAFFRSLVRHLAEGLHVRWVFVAECLLDLRARALAFWQDGNFGRNFEYALAGTPCLEVAEGRTCHVPDRLAEVFPEDRGMVEMGTVSYLGVPLLRSDRRIIGHLVVFDDKPMPADPLEEVERRHIEAILEQTNWMIEGGRGAARILNLHPSTLRSRMQKLGLKRPARVS